MTDKNPIKTVFHSKPQIFLLALLFANFIGGFYLVWESLVSIWSGSDDYSHGFFVLPLCIFIIW
jgi:zona occludens toxin (predicted ATPase)